MERFYSDVTKVALLSALAATAVLLVSYLASLTETGTHDKKCNPDGSCAHKTLLCTQTVEGYRCLVRP